MLQDKLWTTIAVYFDQHLAPQKTGENTFLGTKSY